MIRKLLGLTVITMVLAVALGAPAFAAPGDITLASTDNAGTTRGKSSSFTPSISADGTKVAFSTFGQNLDPGDTDTLSDIYVKDLTTGIITLASSDDDGTMGNADSFTPSLSADATKVAFTSYASNLDPGDPDSNIPDIYVKDLSTGDITLASTDDTGAKGNDDSFDPSISADGTKVAFWSHANLDPGDTDPLADIYVKDLSTGDITLASTDDTGAKGNGDSFAPSISADGTKVAFVSGASNLDSSDIAFFYGVYVKDLTTGNITVASTDSAGTTKANGDSFTPSISADGTKVAFTSLARNLDPGDTDSLQDVYVKDLTTANITLASTNDTRVKGNEASSSPSLSADATKVAFSSHASNLDPGDSDFPADIYVKDLTTGNITLASTDDAGAKGNDVSFDPSLSADGTRVAFGSEASNLDQGDTDSLVDIYVKELPVAAAGTADLSITKSDRRDPVRVGRPIRYTLNLRNLGPDRATGVTVRDQLPAGVSFISASRGGTCIQAAGTVACTYGSPLMAGAHRKVLIRVLAPSTAGSISNTARVSGNEADPVPGNNQDTETTNVT